MRACHVTCLAFMHVLKDLDSSGKFLEATMIFNVAMVTFQMTLLRYKFTNTFMDDGLVHPLASRTLNQFRFISLSKPLPFLVSNL